MIDPSTTTVEVRWSSGPSVKDLVSGAAMGILHNTQSSGIVKDFTGWDNLPVGVAEEVFERLRRVIFEGEHVERMAALNARMKLSPGVIKMLMRLSKEDGVSMGDVARAIGVDPSYITALVDDLDQRGLARREPAPYDRRVKIIVLTDEGRRVGEEINAILSVPPAAFNALSQAELRELRTLLDKILGAMPETGDASATKVTAAAAS